MKCYIQKIGALITHEWQINEWLMMLFSSTWRCKLLHNVINSTITRRISKCQKSIVIFLNISRRVPYQNLIKLAILEK